MYRMISRSILVATLAMGCASRQIDVLVNYDQATDFSGAKTYKWAEISPKAVFPIEAQDPEGLHRLIQAAADQELRDKGFEISEQPRYLLTYAVTVGQRSVSNPQPSTTDWDPTQDPTEYSSGVLAIDFLDPSTNTRVWRGAAMTDLKKGEGHKTVPAVVIKILEKFPPRQ